MILIQTSIFQAFILVSECIQIIKIIQMIHKTPTLVSMTHFGQYQYTTFDRRR